MRQTRHEGVRTLLGRHFDGVENSEMDHAILMDKQILKLHRRW